MGCVDRLNPPSKGEVGMRQEPTRASAHAHPASGSASHLFLTPSLAVTSENGE
jgi:hypothetical protein